MCSDLGENTSMNVKILVFSSCYHCSFVKICTSCVDIYIFFFGDMGFFAKFTVFIGRIFKSQFQFFTIGRVMDRTYKQIIKGH